METEAIPGVATWESLKRTPTAADFNKLDEQDPATTFVNTVFRATHLWAAQEYYDMIRVLATLLNDVEITSANSARQYMTRRRWVAEAQRGEGTSSAFAVGWTFADHLGAGHQTGTVVLGALAQAASECHSPYTRAALINELEDTESPLYTTLTDALTEAVADLEQGADHSIEQLATVVATGVRALNGQLPYVWEVKHSVDGNGGQAVSVAPPGATAEILTVTPTMAKEWLEANHSNRKVRPEKLRTYSEDMRNGRWEFNGDAIRFDTEGNVLDGQHRLMAVQLSGVAVQLLVVRSLRTESQRTMDIGMVRTTADVLGWQGFPHPTMCASISRWSLIREAGGLRQSTTVSPSKPQAADWAQQHRSEVIRAAEVAVMVNQRTTLPVSPSAVGLAYMLAARKDPEGADTFFVHHLIGGYDLTARHPAGQFARRVQTQKRQTGVTMNADDCFSYLVLAWNYWREGREVDKLQSPRGGWNVSNIPEPV